MNLLHILVGFAAAAGLLVLTALISRPKETIVYEDELITQRGKVRWTRALHISIVETCIFVIFSMPDGAVGALVLGIFEWVICGFLSETSFIIRLFTIINYLLLGLTLAQQIPVWGWF